MTRYHNISNERVPFTSKEETARDVEEANVNRNRPHDPSAYKAMMGRRAIALEKSGDDLGAFKLRLKEGL